MNQIQEIASLSSEEWHNKLKEAKILRDGAIYLNASEISYWLGNNKYVSPAEILVKKLSGEKTDPTEYMQMGIQLEDYIISKVFQIEGLAEYKREEWQVYRTGYIGSTSDGIEVFIGGKPDAMAFKVSLLDGDLYETRYVVEVKYMATYKTSDFKYIPEWYLNQVYSYSIIFNMPVIFGSFMSDGFLIKHFYPNEHQNEIEEFKRSVISLAENLYMKNMDYFDVKNKNFLKRKVTGKTDRGKIIAEYIEFLEKNKGIIDAYNDFAKKRDAYLNKIKNVLPQGEYYYDGKKLVIRETKKLDFNLEKFREDNPHLYELYCTEKEMKYVFYDGQKSGNVLFEDEEI